MEKECTRRISNYNFRTAGFHLDEVSGTLVIELQYDGNWEVSAEGNKGIGLRTIEDRLKTIGGHYIIRKNSTGIDIHIQVLLH